MFVFLVFFKQIWSLCSFQLFSDNQSPKGSYRALHEKYTSGNRHKSNGPGFTVDPFVFCFCSGLNPHSSPPQFGTYGPPHRDNRVPTVIRNGERPESKECIFYFPILNQILKFGQYGSVKSKTNECKRLKMVTRI